MVSTRVSIPGYHVTEELYNGLKTQVYRGYQQTDSLPVVIKLLKNPYPSFSELVQFRNQYTIAKNLNSPLIIQTYSLETYQNGYALVMEDFGGISLKEWGVAGTIPSLHEFFPVAIALCNALEILYREGIIHKDIKPSNILINPETKQVKLIDFSIASLLPRETQTLISPNVLEGTLAYISPEQTGRMNRGIDYRTDFYSLGVTFYELLTGELPFKSNDAMELVHCHIAKNPQLIHKINPQIPPVLAKIVSKLMAKNSEDRYQSALGLKFDLETCWHQLKETGKIENFEISQRDVCDRFIIPEKLYGRETEVETLLQAFTRVSLGATEMMLIAGFSGIGKTAVINEVHKPIVRQHGYFTKGKFDQFNRNIPFSAFVQAFRDLMGQLLTESDAQIQQWKSKILDAVGEAGQVIIEVIPELERIIGKQPLAPELSGTAAQNRFNLLFQKFTKLFTSVSHPLVMFLDDLQWADSASLKLIQLLMSDTGYLLLIGAYRDNEVSPVHPLMLTLGEIAKTSATINTITLSPLSQCQVNNLVADTLKCTEDLASPLSILIFQKTQGNPFFATQFIKALHQDKLIQFDLQSGCWECDIAQVTQQAVTDDVVAFMVFQLQKLPQVTQEILQLAACIGNQFDLATLAIVSEYSEVETADFLWQALQSGLILPISDIYKFYQGETNNRLVKKHENNKQQLAKYRFLHDRVQQAAYSLIPDRQKQTTHYHIGQLLLQQISPAARVERIFELVNQLNHGTDLITQQTEREELAQLNLIACRKAKAATAYQAAREYVTVGLSLLCEKAWQQQYEITLALHELAAEVAMLCGDFEAMEQLINIVIQQAHSLPEQVNVYRLKIQSHVSRSQFFEAIAIAQTILQQLGVTLKETPTPTDIQQEFQALAELIADREIEDFVHLPVMTDESKLAIVQIATSIISAAHITSSPLLPLLVALSVKLSIQHGNTPVSAFNYAMYGIMLCNMLKDVDTAVKFGQLALQVVYKLDAKEIKSEVLAALGAFILHRNSHIKETLLLSHEGYATGLEVGNIEFAGNNAINFCLNSFWCCQPLATLEQETRTYCNDLVQLHHLTAANRCRIIWQSTLNLLGFAEYPWLLSGEALQETEFLPQLLSANDLCGVYCFYMYKLALCFWFGEIEQAANYTVEARRYLIAGVGFVNELALYFYDSLIVLAQLSQGLDETSEAFQRIAENQTQLQHWAHYAPMNHQHKVDLVEAEKNRVLGKHYEAGDFYDRAILGAKANGYMQEEALANELAAKFYLEWGKEKVAAGYMQEAYYCYARWGAKAKINDLENRYPQLLQLILQQQKINLNPLETIAVHKASLSTRTSTTNSTSYSEILDFTSVLKAAQAISSSLKLDELIASLIHIILENSGAKKAVLLLPQDHTWQVRAIAVIENRKIHTILEPQSLDTCQDIPIKIIHYVKNTQQTIVIDSCTTDIPGVIGEYMLQNCPQSVLCTPIVNQGHLLGILYLENKLTAGVFTSDRLEILNFLCAQAAISLENASLYAQAQEQSQALQQSEKRYRFLATATSQIIWLANLAGENTDTVHWMEYTGQTEAEVKGTGWLNAIHPDDIQQTIQDWNLCVQKKSFYKTEYRIRGADGNYRYFAVRGVPLLAEDGSIAEWIGTCTDIDDRKKAELALEQKSLELEQALHNLQNAQLQMVQSEKMSALGNLVAGVAHEMNNPLGFIAASLKQAQPTINDIFEHLQLYQECLPNPSDEIKDHAVEIDLDYSLEDLPKVINSMIIACDRLKNISTSLRTFSRADQDYKVPFNIHEGLNSTILILKHRLKANEQRPAIEVITEYGNLPLIECFPGQLNQVFMNIISNAIDALDEVNLGHNYAENQAMQNRITIQTSVQDKNVEIKIADNGIGMNEEVKQKIFDHLFTTKAVGKGTGLGLAIAKQIIVEKHGGSLQCNSSLGEGTEFVILIPIQS